MKIEQARDIDGLITSVLRMRRQKAIPKPIGKDQQVEAEINHSRWIARCPYCSGAEMVSKADPRFFCLSCLNKGSGGRFLSVTFPRWDESIEAELMKRPEANRNWKAETVTKLRKENKRNGVK